MTNAINHQHLRMTNELHTEETRSSWALGGPSAYSILSYSIAPKQGANWVQSISWTPATSLSAMLDDRWCAPPLKSKGKPRSSLSLAMYSDRFWVLGGCAQLVANGWSKSHLAQPVRTWEYHYCHCTNLLQRALHMIRPFFPSSKLHQMKDTNLRLHFMWKAFNHLT